MATDLKIPNILILCLLEGGIYVSESVEFVKRRKNEVEKFFSLFLFLFSLNF